MPSSLCLFKTKEHFKDRIGLPPKYLCDTSDQNGGEIEYSGGKFRQLVENEET
jgi:hypothetical protein